MATKQTANTKPEPKEEKTPSQPAAAAPEAKAPEQPETKAAGKPNDKAPNKVPGLRVTAGKDGFRRAGRAWSGITEVRRDALTDEQVKQLMEEPRLVVTEIEIEG